MKISELRPGLRNVDTAFKVLEKLNEREVTSRISGKTHRVAEFLVGDETANVVLTLWNNDIEKVEVGKSYELKNGFVNIFKNSMRLALSRRSELKEKEGDVEASKDSENISDRQIRRRARPRRF